MQGVDHQSSGLVPRFISEPLKPLGCRVLNRQLVLKLVSGRWPSLCPHETRYLTEPVLDLPTLKVVAGLEQRGRVLLASFVFPGDRVGLFVGLIQPTRQACLLVVQLLSDLDQQLFCGELGLLWHETRGNL